MARSGPALWAVVMAGGSGTRFWPVSRAGRPKQFLPPGGGNPAASPRQRSRDSLLAQAVGRLDGLIPPERILIIGSAAHRRLIRETLPDIPPNRIILEPEGRNTAPCLGLAAHLIESWEPGAVMAAFPADHRIGRPAVLRRLARAGAALAERRDAIVTLGIPPQWPETGYGYIQAGRKFPAPGGGTAFAAEHFIEKPPLPEATRYFNEGGYYWNAGIFICRAERLIGEIDRNLPETARLLRRAATSLRQGQRAAFERAFLGCQAISVDYAVMERASGVVVLPAEMEWSDLGSWSVLRRILPLGEGGNLWMLPRNSRSVAIDSRNLVVRSSKPLVAALGVENLVLIETEDAILLCAGGRDQSVGDLVRKLADEGLGRFL
ncbi:MAG: sugar phosphate nucleotidyltransferase [Nitrospinota bacterium]